MFNYFNFYFTSYSLASITDLIKILFTRLSGRLSQLRTEEFILFFNERYDGKKTYLFNSARSSLYFLLKSLDFKKGSQILTVGFTCEAVPNAIINAGYRPVYTDINSEIFSSNVESIKDKLSQEVKAIIIQHSFGVPSDIEEIINLAKKENIISIEDCAASLLSRKGDRRLGTFADFSFFSFELSKTLSCLRGGALVIRNCEEKTLDLIECLYRDIKKISPLGEIKIAFQVLLSLLLYSPRVFFFSRIVLLIIYKTGLFRPSTTNKEYKGLLPKDYLLKLSGIQILMLQLQFTKESEILDKVSSNIDLINKNLSDYKEAARQESYLLRFPILVKNRSQVIQRLKKSFIEPGLWFEVPLSSRKIDHSDFFYEWGCCPKSEMICEKIINLHVHPKANKKKILKMVDIVKPFIDKKAYK